MNHRCLVAALDIAGAPSAPMAGLRCRGVPAMTCVQAQPIHEAASPARAKCARRIHAVPQQQSGGAILRLAPAFENRT